MHENNLYKRFNAIVGESNVRATDEKHSVDGVRPHMIVAPGSEEHVATVLQSADEAGLAVLPRGGGTKLSLGNPPTKGDIILSTERLNHLLEHAYGDMTATAEAGITLATLQEKLKTHGQMLALDAPFPEHATLGGLIATNTSGPLRVRYGTLRDLVIGIGVVLPDGTRAQSGGKVVKNVAGYDLMKLFTGALGTLGMITTVTVRLHPLPATTGTIVVDMPDETAASQFMIDLNHSTLTPTGVQLVAEHGKYAIYVRFGGPAASVATQCQTIRNITSGRSQCRELEDGEAEEAWQAQSAIYDSDDHTIIARISTLPSAIGATLYTIDRTAQRLGVKWQAIIQATGTGILRLDGTNDETLLALAGLLRMRVAGIGGHFVLERLPLSSKARLDIWGAPTDAFPLMRRIKEQFDPHNTLNPGRYVGRI